MDAILRSSVFRKRNTRETNQTTLTDVVINNPQGRWYRKSRFRKNLILYFKPLNERFFYFKYNNDLEEIGLITQNDNGYYNTPDKKYHAEVKDDGFILYSGETLKKRRKVGRFVPL
jgi:hypothetical protein